MAAELSSCLSLTVAPSCALRNRSASIGNVFCLQRKSTFSRSACLSRCRSLRRARAPLLASPGGRSWRVSVSGEDIPFELLQDEKFVRITDGDPRFGPPALLLLGFKLDEALRFQKLLKEMEGDFLQKEDTSSQAFQALQQGTVGVLLCTEDMAQGTLGDAISVSQPNLSEIEIAQGLPRITFISGLTGEETMMLIHIYPEAGLEDTVFAAHVPKNSDKSLEELMEEIMDDHVRLTQQGGSKS